MLEALNGLACPAIEECRFDQDCADVRSVLAEECPSCRSRSVWFWVWAMSGARRPLEVASAGGEGPRLARSRRQTRKVEGDSCRI